MKTKCNRCGQISNIQPEGNLCHTCSSGVMVLADIVNHLINLHVGADEESRHEEA